MRRWPGENEDAAWRLPLALILLVALVTRIYHVSYQNIWFDEAYSWKLAQMDFARILQEAAADVHPPLYYFLLKFWMKFAGMTPAGMRSLSLVASLGLMLMTYLAGRAWAGERAARWALIFMAVAPHQIFYAQEARMYAVTGLLGMLAVYFYGRWMSNRRTGALVAYAVFALLALYTHYFVFLLLIAVQFDFVLHGIRREKAAPAKAARTMILPWLYAHGLMLICFLPWLPTLFRQMARGQSWRHRPGVGEALAGFWNFLTEMTLGYFSYSGDLTFALRKFSEAPFETANLFLLLQQLWMHVAGAGLVLLLIGLGFRRPVAHGRLLVFLGAPLVLGMALSMRQSMQLSRYLGLLFPFLALILGSSITRMGSRKMAWAAGSVLVFAMLLGLQTTYRTTSRDSDYRPVARYLGEVYRPGDAIIVRPDYMAACLEYYLPDAVPIVPRSPEPMGPKRIWVVTDYRDSHFREAQTIEDRSWIIENEIWWPTQNPKTRLMLLLRR